MSIHYYQLFSATCRQGILVGRSCQDLYGLPTSVFDSRLMLHYQESTMPTATEPMPTNIPQSSPKVPRTGKERWPISIRRQVRLAFMRGDGSVYACAKRFGVPGETAMEWFRHENWADLRQQFDTRTMEAAIPASPAVQVSNQPDPQSQAGQEARLDKLLRAIEEQMDGMTNATDLAKLSMAHDKLFRAWQVLTGTQNPGNRKPVTSRSRSTTAIPTPQAVVSADTAQDITETVNPQPTEPQQ